MNSKTSNEKCLEMLGQALDNMKPNDNMVEVKIKNNKWVAKSTYVNQYHKKYYADNIKTDKCDRCGSDVIQFKMQRHQKTKKCIKFSKSTPQLAVVCVTDIQLETITPVDTIVSLWFTQSAFTDFKIAFESHEYIDKLSKFGTFLIKTTYMVKCIYLL